jgi:hypothetical protein
MDPIDINKVRQTKHWLKNFDRIRPFIEAIETAPLNQKRECLFIAACAAKQMLDEGIGTKRSHYFVLRGAVGFDLPPEEAERVIAAAFFRAKPR